MLNEKGTIKEYDLKVYPIHFVIAIGDLEKEVNKLYKPYDEAYNWIGHPGKEHPACTYRVKNKKTGNACVLVWIPKIDDFRGSYICHEAGHSTLEIFSYIGAKVSYNDQEPFCYLLGVIFKCCNQSYYELKDFLDKKKSKKPKKRNKYGITRYCII